MKKKRKSGLTCKSSGALNLKILRQMNIKADITLFNVCTDQPRLVYISYPYTIMCDGHL